MALSDDEVGAVKQLKAKLETHDEPNRYKFSMYDQRRRVRDLGLSIPDRMKWIDAVAGWPSTTVDVLEERLDMETFGAPATLGLDQVFSDNSLDSESGMGHLDALIAGAGFVAVGVGDTTIGEPETLITVEAPTRMTCTWDQRTRRISQALNLVRNQDGKVQTGTLYLPNVNISFHLAGNGVYAEDQRDIHNFGRVTVARLVNRPRSSNNRGRSEITPAIRYLTEAAMRTLLGAEVAREFYSAPQRWVIGASGDTFTDEAGKQIDGWTAVMGRLMDIPYNDDDPEHPVTPTAGQFPSNSPAPYFDQLRGYAQLMAAEAAVPSSYLGFISDNPASADAIHALEARLVKRAERRQGQFGRAWAEAARLAWLFQNDGATLPVEAFQIKPLWVNAATPTIAAQADAGSKVISSLGLPNTSEVAWDLVGLSEQQKQQLRVEQQRDRQLQMTQNLSVAAQAALQNPQLKELVGANGAGTAGAPANQPGGTDNGGGQ